VYVVCIEHIVILSCELIVIFCMDLCIRRYVICYACL
jgi:hypothetical protein